MIESLPDFKAIWRKGALSPVLQDGQATADFGETWGGGHGDAWGKGSVIDRSELLDFISVTGNVLRDYLIEGR